MVRKKMKTTKEVKATNYPTPDTYMMSIVVKCFRNYIDAFKKELTTMGILHSNNAENDYTHVRRSVFTTIDELPIHVLVHPVFSVKLINEFNGNTAFRAKMLNLCEIMVMLETTANGISLKPYDRKYYNTIVKDALSDVSNGSDASVYNELKELGLCYDALPVWYKDFVIAIMFAKFETYKPDLN